MALLELKNVVASYGNINALKGISLSVPEGKIVTLIGANGTGTGRPSDSSEYDRSGKSADGSLSAPGQGRNGQGHESYI